MGDVMTVKASVPLMTDMPGLWRRSLIERADGLRDITTRVNWLQGQTLFVDLRQPQPAPVLHQARSLQDLSLQDCLALATQEGFAGRLLFDGHWFEWQRSIDYQPQAALADAGRLFWESGVLVEEGRDARYVEHWHRDPAVVTRPLYAMRLRGAGQSDAMLVRAGAVFMFARGRSTTVAPGHTLEQCVLGAASVTVARALVDCEISLGEITAGRYLIQASTLPYRVGQDLKVATSGSFITTSDTAPRGETAVRRWEVIEAE